MLPLAHAVLSKHAFDHGHNLRQGNRSPFNEARHHPQMNQQGLVNLGLCSALAFTAGIEQFLLEFALGGLIIGGAPLRGAFLAVGEAASKGTVYIPSSGITKIGQKDNIAVPAPFQAWLEVRVLS